MKKLKGAVTDLERAVQAECNSYVDNYSNGVIGFLSDLVNNGCASGMVGSLIYYTDTIKFYLNHKTEIQALLRDMCEDTGLTPQQLFKDKWYKEDMFAEDTHNQNLLAWFGFEETARRLAYKNGLEV